MVLRQDVPSEGIIIGDHYLATVRQNTEPDAVGTGQVSGIPFHSEVRISDRSILETSSKLSGRNLSWRLGSLSTSRNRQDGCIQIRMPAESVCNVQRTRYVLPAVVETRHIFKPACLTAVQGRHTLQERKGFVISFHGEWSTLKVAAPFFQGMQYSQQFLLPSSITTLSR